MTDEQICPYFLEGVNHPILSNCKYLIVYMNKTAYCYSFFNPKATPPKSLAALKLIQEKYINPKTFYTQDKAREANK